MRQTVKIRRGIRRIAVTINHYHREIRLAKPVFHVDPAQWSVLSRREALTALSVAGVHHQGLLCTNDTAEWFYY